mgnify:CR=1 FL=1
MVPRISKPGRSFRFAAIYYGHDRGTIATSERVGWTYVLNSHTDDPGKAVRWMIVSHQAANASKEEQSAPGRRIEKPVWTWSLAVSPDQGDPGQEYWLKAAKSFLAEHGLADQPTVLYAHTDERHAHVHGLTTLIDPATGSMKMKTILDPKTGEEKIVPALSNAQLASSRWAQRWEEAEGRIYCEQRVQNNARRDQGEHVKYQDPELDQKTLITKLYYAADSGKAFEASLAEHGLRLAQGKRIVILDEAGKMYNISRQIEGVKAKDIRAKLADLQLGAVEELRQQQELDRAQKQQAAEQQKAQEAIRQQEESFDRDQYEVQWQMAIVDAAIEAREREPSANVRSKDQDHSLALPHDPPSARINAVQNRQLDELGIFYTENQLARLNLSSDLGRQYGEHEGSLRENMTRAQEALKEAGRIRTWWMKLTGEYGWRQKELQAMRLTLEDIEGRKREALQALERRIEEQRRAIAVRHEQERRAMQPAVPREEALPQAMRAIPVQECPLEPQRPTPTSRSREMDQRQGASYSQTDNSLISEEFNEASQDCHEPENSYLAFLDGFENEMDNSLENSL